MARLYNTFEFIGNISIPKDTEKFHRVNEFDSGWVMHQVNFAVQESKTNSVFVDLQGGYSKSNWNVVKTFGKGTENEKGTMLEIPWEDRLKPEAVDMVADFKKIVVDFTTDQKLKEEIRQLSYEIRTIEYKDTKTDEDNEKLEELKQQLSVAAKDRKEFIHAYDAVNYLAEHLEKYKDHKFRITGQVSFSESKKNFYRNFNIESIEIVPDDAKSQLKATMDIFFTKDSLDDKDFKEEKKVYINGYVMSYDRKAKKDQFFPQQYVINAQKIDFDNPKQAGLFNFIKSKFDVKGKGVHHLQWEVNIFRGADRVEFTEKDLTPAQKEAIEFGFNKLEDFAPKGGMLGDTVYENRLVKPNLKAIDNENNFTEGSIESTYDVEDLEFEFTVFEDKKQDDIGTVETIEEIEKESASIDIDSELDNLFG